MNKQKLPEGWKEVEFQEIASFIAGFAFSSSDYKNSGTKIIRIQNLGNNKDENFVYWDKDYDKKYLIKKGDLLLSLSGTIPVSFKIHTWKGDDALLNQRILKICLNEDLANKHYIEYAVFNSLINVYSKATSTTGIANVSMGNVKSLRIILPPLETQKKIVSLLEKIEKSKEWRKEADDLTKDFLKSVFLEMFGNPATNPMDFPKKDLLSFSSEKPKYGSGASAINYDGKIRYIRITDIDENGILRNSSIASPSEFDEEYLLEKGDLIFARTGATVGKTYLHQENNKDSIYAGYMIRFRFNKNECNPVYIYHLAKSKYYWSWVNHIQTQATQPNINAKQYGSLEIPLPPIPLQNKFASIVKQVEAIKKQQKDSKAQIDNLFNALMQKAFKGKLKC